jgi:hypothetical protein
LLAKDVYTIFLRNYCFTLKYKNHFMKPIILSLLFIATMHVAANAQISLGPEVGFVESNYKGQSMGNTDNTSVKLGFDIGGVVSIRMVGGLFIQPGLLYVRNGAEFPNGAGSMSINTLEVPVNLLYKFAKPGRDGLFVGLGPYIARNLSGVNKQTDPIYGNSTSSVAIGTDPNTDAMKPFDLGLGFNAGYGLMHGFFVCIHYQVGLVNLTPGGNAQNTLQSMNFGMSAGYLFWSHAKKKNTQKKTM